MKKCVCFAWDPARRKRNDRDAGSGRLSTGNATMRDREDECLRIPSTRLA